MRIQKYIIILKDYCGVYIIFYIIFDYESHDFLFILRYLYL